VNKPLRIAVDAMGGDEAPRSVILGALEARRERGNFFDLLLVGDRGRIERELKEAGEDPSTWNIRHTTEIIEMGDPPAVAVRRKKDSSINVGVMMEKEGSVDAFFSAGNTGAVVAASLFTLGRLESVSRPAIPTYMPTRRGYGIVLDVGANSDCTPQNLLQFAVMGNVYAERVLSVQNPAVGLLNIGEESGKGNETAAGAHRLLKESGLHFIGNVEGRDVFRGKADVVVCDGFVGNVVLKFSESLVHILQWMVKDEIRKNLFVRIGAVLMGPAFRNITQKLDYAEYGGCPLLGVDGVVIIGHGNSSPRAIKNAIFVAEKSVEANMNELIVERLRGTAGVLERIS
jgi:glycerol-3-phosphate acyltransferase PlsX